MRITAKHLKTRIDTLNTMTGNPTEYMTAGKCNPGHYYLSKQCGGYELHQVSNSGGGVRAIGNTGHIPARELNLVITGMIDILYYTAQITAHSAKG